MKNLKLQHFSRSWVCLSRDFSNQALEKASSPLNQLANTFKEPETKSFQKRLEIHSGIIKSTMSQISLLRNN